MDINSCTNRESPKENIIKIFSDGSFSYINGKGAWAYRITSLNEKDILGQGSGELENLKSSNEA